MRELRSLLPYFLPYRRGMMFGLLLVVVSNVFTLAGPYLLKVAIDALEQNLSMELILRYAGLIVGVAIVGGVARYGMRELLNGISRRIERDLRADLFDHLLRLPPTFYDGWRTGDLMSRSTNDVLAVRQVAGPAIMYLVNTATVTTLALGLMFWIDVSLTLFAMIPMAVLPAAVYYFGEKIHVRFERIQDQFSELSNYAQENLAGIRIVKAYTQAKGQSREFGELNEDYLRRNMHLARVWGAFHPSLTLFTGLAAVVALWYGGLQVMNGSITVGDFVAFTFYLTLLSWPMIALGWVTNLFQRGAASMGRINELMEIEPGIADAAPAASFPDDAPAGRIAFEGVSFRYPGTDRWVLRDISFEVEAGSTVALVGGTASGKTTLVQLIPRLYDATEGTVRVNGIDVRELRLSELRRTISVVPQEPFLFSMRLRRNIVLSDSENGRGAPGETAEPGEGGVGQGGEVGDRDGAAPPTGGRTEDAVLQRSIDVAQLRETLDVLPAGLQTRIGERGVNLSGGQKQRATLARALVRDAPILILDDALSAVDSVTETAILEGLRTFMRDRTALIVSHRVSAVRDADHILVLEGGRIVERGTHDELLTRQGVYARLLERQLLAEEIDELEGDDSLRSAPG